MGYNAITSYVRAKKYVHQKKKEHSARDIYAILSNLLVRRMTSYYSELKYRTVSKRKQDMHKAFTVMHCLSNKLRQYFTLWKQNLENENLVLEVKDEGPIREEVFDQRQVLENCKKLMKQEGYSDSDIA